MADPPPGLRIPWWATALDAAVCVLMIIAAWAFLTGSGLILRVGGVKIQATSELRLTLWAVALFVVRHLAFRRPSLWQRLRRIRNVLLQGIRAVPLAADEFLDRPGVGPLRAMEVGLVTALMALLTVVMMYPQIARLDSVRDLGDPLFSIWRLKWIAHQLPRDPLHLFDANIFHPERYTLAFSDSILLPGIVAAPFLWLGVPDVPLYNVLLLATFVLAGAAMYVLVRTLTGQAPAALVAAMIFAFYPFRFEHYSHFELQFSFWMPLSLVALHRTLAHGRVRHGLLAGAALGAQALSSVYFGIFFSVFLVPVWGVVALARRRVARSVKPLLAGAGVAIALSAPLAWPYLQARQSVGERGYGEMEYYSATVTSYLDPHFSRTTYAGVLRPGAHNPERELFPGILVVVLAFAAVWPPLSATRAAYLVGLIFAFDASLGTHGFVFPILAEHLLPFRALRVPARYSMLVGLSLAILAGYGAARLGASVRRAPLKWLVAAGLAAIALFESRATLAFERVPTPHAVYQWFEGRPTGVIAELPAPEPTTDSLWSDVRYLYPATFHWYRMLNGNSGNYPKSHLAFCEAMLSFPDDESVAFLQRRRVDYVVVHEEYYGRERYREVIEGINVRSALRQVVSVRDRGYEARIYALARPRGS